jgi:hypothetical protein
MENRPHDIPYCRQIKLRRFDPPSFAWSVLFLLLSFSFACVAFALAAAGVAGSWLAWLAAWPFALGAALLVEGVLKPLKMRRRLARLFHVGPGNQAR